jgi:hypothetical protein
VGFIGKFPTKPLISMQNSKLFLYLAEGGGNGVFQRARRPALGANPFPNFRAMDGNGRIDLEAQPHFRALNVEYRDFHQAMQAVGPADNHRFITFSR